MNENVFFVLTGPSGAGKTTYANLLYDNNKDICRHSITYTTRAPRPNEHKSEFFEFISLDTFNEYKRQNKFICSTFFCGNYYAYLKSHIYHTCHKDMIMDSIFLPNELRKIQSNIIIIYLTTSTNIEMYHRIVSRHPDIDKSELSLRVKDFSYRQQIAKQCDYIVKTDAKKGKNNIYRELAEIFSETKRAIISSGCLFSSALDRFKVTGEAIGDLPHDDVLI